MINIIMWKKSPGSNELGFSDVKEYITKKGGQLEDEWNGDLYTDASFTTEGMSLDKIQKELRETFPSLDNVNYESGSIDPVFDQPSADIGNGGAINISYNKRDDKVEKKGPPITQ